MKLNAPATYRLDTTLKYDTNIPPNNEPAPIPAFKLDMFQLIAALVSPSI